MNTDNRAHNHGLLIAQSQKIVVLHVVGFYEDACNRNDKLSNRNYPQPIFITSIPD